MQHWEEFFMYKKKKNYLIWRNILLFLGSIIQLLQSPIPTKVTQHNNGDISHSNSEYNGRGDEAT